MVMRSRRFCANQFVLLLFLSVSTTALSQANVDSVFNMAIENARAGKFDIALQKATKAYNADTCRADIVLYLANIYSWSDKKDSAFIFIRKAKEMNYINDDYYDSYLNILIRFKKYGNVIETCDEAEKAAYKNKLNLLTKRLVAYNELDDFNAGLTLINDTLNKEFLRDEAVDALHTELLLKQRFRTFTANYTLDLFDAIAPQHLASIGLAFEENKNSLGVNLNYASRFAKTDVQIESTAYWVFPTENYWYLNYGYAFNASLFPRHRIGLEYYFKLHPKWEASLGGRYLFYPYAVNRNIVILTGHVGTYFSKSWVALRPFFVANQKMKSLSVSLKYRLYGNSTQDFWGAEFGFGNSPDDMASTSQSSFNELMSFRYKLEKSFKINRISSVFVGMSYIYEQIYQGAEVKNRNRYSFDVGYKYRF